MSDSVLGCPLGGAGEPWKMWQVEEMGLDDSFRCVAPTALAGGG